MPVFQYIATDRSDAIHTGLISSDSPRQARQELREQGFRVTSIAESKSQPSTTLNLAGIWPRNWNHWLGKFTSELATLLSVGVPLLEALDTLIKQYKGSASKNVLHLKDSVSSGKSLAEAMRIQQQVFDELSIKMVEVGENTGRLDQILRQLAEFKLRSVQFKNQVVNALLYPAILFTVSVFVSIFLMTVVVPMLLENLLDGVEQLPWPTLILKSGSDLLVERGWLVLLLAVACVVGISVGLRTEPGKRIRDQILMSIPVIGGMAQKQEISRIALVVATLMKSGVEFLPSIEIAKGTTKNVLLKEALSECCVQIEAGREIGLAFANRTYFPPLVTQVFTVGQKSGQLDDMLFQLSADYDRQVESTSERLGTIVEPVLILVISAFIGFIMFATLMPIMEAGNIL